MKKPKRLSKRKLQKLNDNQRKEYYKNCVEYYGNMPNQLKHFKQKLIFHPIIRFAGKAIPLKAIKLNDPVLPSDNSPVIFSLNHNNVYDLFVFSSVVKRHCFAITDFTLLNDKSVALLWRLNGTVFLDRQSKESAKNALEQAVRGIRDGNNMLIFPESTWNLTKSLPILPRHWGDVRIAQETGAPIVPVILEYTGKVCIVKFGKCIYVSKEDSVVEKDREVYEAMVRLKNEIKESEEYKKQYVPIEYTEWLRKQISSYKNYDIEYETSCIRNDGSIPQEELEEILKIGEEIHPTETIRERLKCAKVNYRYDE